MSEYPAPTRNDHDRFCTTEGWTVVRGATGRPVAHHRTYELTVPSGDVFRTRISRPINAETYGRQRWAHILRDQLAVSAEEFWACVKDGVPPDRGSATPEPPAEAIPLGVLMALKNEVGFSDEQLAAMTKDEAVARLNEYWASGPRE